MTREQPHKLFEGGKIPFIVERFKKNQEAVIFSDLDQTIVTGGQVVKGMFRIAEQGTTVIPITVRASRRVLELPGVGGLPRGHSLISYGGACVRPIFQTSGERHFEKETRLEGQLLDRSLNKIQKAFDKKVLKAVMFFPYNQYAVVYGVEKYKSHPTRTMKRVENFQKFSQRAKEDPPFQIFCVKNPEHELGKESPFPPNFEITANQGGWNVRPPGIDKGQAYQEWCDFYKIKPWLTMGAGDSFADLEFLRRIDEQGGQTILVGHEVPEKEFKPTIRVVTPDEVPAAIGKLMKQL
ncbi:MAG: HAD hydrolase family protein [Candidatus Moranbacteria bacterium]|nr:HAD hydrolase family protein [Candidatus Moranbacteria bacterium]